MPKMKLNKYQYAWIRKLKSGETIKAKERLFGRTKKHNCCLGVGARVCNELEPSAEELHIRCHSNYGTLNGFRETMDRLNLRDDCGTTDWKKVSMKWQRKIEKRFTSSSGYGWHSMTALADINDFTDLSHREIGCFIDENREAVFCV